jgi:hypothetical protein
MTESNTSGWFTNYVQEQQSLETHILNLNEEKEKLTTLLRAYKHPEQGSDPQPDTEFERMVSQCRALDTQVGEAFAQREELEIKLVAELKADPQTLQRLADAERFTQSASNREDTV